MRDKSFYRQVASLHISAINQGFLSSLGLGFLALIYQSIDECERSFLLVEEKEGRVIGFISGANGMGPIYRRMLSHFIRLSIALGPTLVNPVKLWRIFEVLTYSMKNTSNRPLPRYELISIAVAKQDRGQGVAEHLYRRLTDNFRICGVSEFRIIVGDALAPAHRFYQKMGAIAFLKTSIHGGQSSTVYLQKIST